MKKVLSIALVLVMVLAIFAGCGAKEAAPAGKTIYVTGPTPDHGWTAQAGAYAEKKVEEINAAGKYKAVYMPASSGEEQVDLVQTIIANGDAAGVVFFALVAATKADLEAMEVYISAIGGMQELYDVMAGKEGTQAPIAAQYFDDMMSVFFSPKMMTNVIGYMEDYLAGNWDYEVGAGKYEVVWIVDKNNVSEYEGFTGHAE